MIIKEKEKNENKSNERKNNYVCAFVGTNRTGKSSVAKFEALNYKRANPENKVIAFDIQDRFTGIADEYIYPHESLDSQLDEIHDCLLILDDYKALNRKNILEKSLLKVLILREKRNIDIIYICHNPKQIVWDLTYYTSFYYIFYTYSKNGQFEGRIPAYELCINASKLINNYVVKLGNKGEYPNFPHFIVDTDNEKLIAKNINSKLFNQVYKEMKNKNK